MIKIIPATKEASLNLYEEINRNNNDGSVSKFWFLKNEIIVKSPNVITVEKEKTYNIFFFIRGNIII